MNGRNEKIIQIDVLLADKINPRRQTFGRGRGVAFVTLDRIFYTQNI